MTKAIEKFQELEQGVLGIVRAADVYALHIMAKIRNEEPPLDAIISIIDNKKISGLNLIGGLYKKTELEMLEKEGHFSEIGQQIIVAAHTALESYLILKFREYYRYLVASTNDQIVEETLKKIHFRSLDDFKGVYRKFFNIHLPSFEIDFHTSEGCNFCAKNCWEALQLLYTVRNDIVHKGAPADYKVSTLMDSWYPFEFVRKWVPLFNANFDYFIYEKRETNLYREYKMRVNNL